MAETGDHAGQHRRQPEFVIAPDAEGAAAEAARLIADHATTGNALVLAGGSTPARAYELAAAERPDWDGVELWFGDDRCVPADDPRSNQLLVDESLVTRLGVRPVVHPIATELAADAAAAAYDAEIRDARFDLVLLGLGPDGHTASLFPHAATLDEHERLAVAATAGLEPFVERVTMTIPALSSATHVVFLAVGSDKAAAVRRAFADEPSRATPASLVRSRTGRTTVILDRDAAALLS